MRKPFLALLAVPLLLASSAFAMQKGTVKFFNETKGFGICEGELVDEKSGQSLRFIQAAFQALGLGAGSEVHFEARLLPGQKAPIAVYLSSKNGPPLRRGKGIIKIIRDNESGLLVDEKTGQEIEFAQPFASELGLHEGAAVVFEVAEGKKGLNAVNVKKA
jgi:cold shock CspA family protein